MKMREADDPADLDAIAAVRIQEACSWSVMRGKEGKQVL